MKKSQKLNRAVRRTRWENFKYRLKRIITFPWRVCCAIWNWLKQIDIVGMINLTLLVLIILLFSSLIVDLVRYRKCSVYNSIRSGNNITAVAKNDSGADSRRIVKRTFNTTLPIKADKKTNITPKVKTIGVAKPQVVKETSLPASELPKQSFSGNIVIEI